MVDELAKRFADLAAKYGPDVISAARGAARMEALSCLVGSLIAFGFAAALLLAARSCFSKYPDWRGADDWFIPPRFVGWCCVAAGAVPLAIGVWAWIDPWTWAAMASPELWIAKRALKL